MGIAASRPVVLVGAAAGYGKTTLIAQWLDQRSSPRLASAWLTLEAIDNDPGVLCRRMATALERAGCELEFDTADVVAAERGNLAGGFLPGLFTAMASLPAELFLVLDDFHVVQEPACLTLVQLLVERLPPQAHMLIATRADPGLRLGRLRAGGQLAEIRAADLAFDAEEVASLLATRRLRLSDAVVSQLLDLTEGWPAGLALAISSLEGQADPEGFVRKLRDSNRFIGDYLTEEVLSQQPDPIRELIITMSIVNRMSAELCDHVLETTGSARILRDLERANVFLDTLDEKRSWFRFHPLFAAVARGELEREQPERIPLLHARAAEWFQARGLIEETLTHLLASGDTDEAARIVHAHWMKYVDAGQAATVLRWFGTLGRPPIASDPAAAVTAAWMAGMAGDEAALAAHVATLQEHREYGPLSDGTRSVESALALIQGLFGYGGPAEMLTSARRAVELETNPGSPHYAIAHLTLGHAAYVVGDLPLAAEALVKASLNQAAPTTTRLLALSNHSLVEAERGQTDLGRTLAERAMEVAEEQGLTATPGASLAFTALAQALAASGDIVAAMSMVEQGLTLRRQDPAHAPWLTMHHLVVAARVAAEAGDLSRARELAEEAAMRMDRFPEGMVQMRARLMITEQLLRNQEFPEALIEPLTPRERDVLRLLQGSSSFVEIARELSLSPNTVKTHSQALYRKLGAGSRAQAVSIARHHRLI